MRERIYSVVKIADVGERLSKCYDIFIVIVAIVSICPLMVKDPYSSSIMHTLDLITVYILFLDYILRWITYDYISGKKAPWAFLVYPFTFFALMDFLSLLPSLGLLSQGAYALRLFRLFKMINYSKSFVYIANVFKEQKKVLLSILLIAIVYVFVAALIMFIYEPDTFDNFFHALYWSTTVLTTVGYGDVYPVSNVGRLISMISSIFGIGVIALPAGVVTGGFVEEISKNKQIEAEKKAALAAQKAADANSAANKAKRVLEEYIAVHGKGNLQKEAKSKLERQDGLDVREAAATREEEHKQ